MEIIIQALLTAVFTVGLLQGVHYARQYYYEQKESKRKPPVAQAGPDWKETGSNINAAQERICDGPCRQPTHSYVTYDDGTIECFSCAGKI